MSDKDESDRAALPAPKGPRPEEKPPRVAPRIIAAPKIRQLYWCDFWRDAQLPEFWKTRPVVVVSYRNSLHGPCLVLPTSTDPQDGNPWARKLSIKPDGRSESWVICNQLSTVAVSRLSQFKGRIPRLSETEFDEILALLLEWLPTPTTPVGLEK